MVKDKKTSEALKQANQQVLTMQRYAREGFGTTAGKIMLRYIHDTAGFTKSSTCTDPQSGEIQPHATAYHQGRRDVYLELRKLLAKSPDLLAEVELGVKIPIQKKRVTKKKTRGKS